VADARAVQRATRQSPYKMRLVIDQIRGKSVNDALATLKFSKKHAARQIEKVLTSAVANAEYRGRSASEPVDVDELFVKHAVINEGPKLKRFMPAAMGRANPIQKRTSHVEIVIAERARAREADQRSAGRGTRVAAKTQRATSARGRSSPTSGTSKKKGR